MAAAASAGEFLAFFGCQCHGIKFYEWEEAGRDVIRPLRFQRDPSNRHDSNCVEVMVETSWKLGHVAKEAAQWLSPLLLGPFRIRG